MQKRNLNKSRFATLLKSHPRTDRPPKIRSTSTEHPPLGQHLRETVSHVRRSLKDLIYKKFLFTFVKRNLLTLKMNKKQINK